MLMKKIWIGLCAVILALTVVITVGGQSKPVSNISQDKESSSVTDSLIQTDTSGIEETKPVTSVAVSAPKEENEDVILDLIEIKQEEIRQESNVKQPETISNETGGLDVPFDVAYPEIFEQNLLSYSDETIMIKFDLDFIGKAKEELVNTGIDHLEEMFKMNNAVWYTAYVAEGKDIKEVMASVRVLDYVQVAEYNFQYETAEIEWDEIYKDNTEYVNQWYRDSYGIKEGWEYVAEKTGNAGGKSSVIVAVIDSGVDYTHPDLAVNMWKNTKEIPDNGIDDDGNGFIDDYYGANMYVDYNGYSDNSNGMDDNGHGTHVAGIIAAVNNKEGVVGLANNVQIMNIKAADASGYLLQNNIAKAILYAYDKGAEVINMSFGGTASSIAVQDALETAYTRAVLVASAGNNGAHDEYYLGPIPNYPAAHSYVLGVMSVGQNNVESVFTNYDVLLYSNVEYEVYAPGEQIISTLPDGRYGKLSGTSMSAPIVAAQAALLRSIYSDHKTYPTKFIYGQIVGTADDIVQCFDPGNHGIHNIPGVVNVYKSLTELPQPDVGVSEYTLFDTAGFEEDINAMNNGDGVVDAGETIALGFTLKNRWGMSKNTTVTLDAISDLGGSNPYVTFLNNDINYGSVGTYSESDSGKIYTDDMWTGWENPFYVRISKDCPNNYSVTLNVTVRYENGLDENDEATYVNDSYQMTFIVRRGVVLPNLIEEDMTLTKDNFYIIPNSTTVREGATLTIEAGTKIQFWCSDPSDAYADTAITYLKVEGTLISEGTEEEPVEMFPSDWMDRYRVEIQREYDAYVELNYTKITNPYVAADIINNCEFTYNYADDLYFRYLAGGHIYWTSGSSKMEVFDTLFGSAFYKVTTLNIISPMIDTCIFVDSHVYLSGEMNNNVFYGNSSITEDGNQYVTSITPEDTMNHLKVEDFFEVNDYIYFTVKSKKDNETIMNRFFDLIDVDWFSINSKEEYDQVLTNIESQGSSHFYNINLQKNAEGEYVNHDGSKINGVTVDSGMKDPILANNNYTAWSFIDYYGEGLGYHEIAEKKSPYVKTLKLDEYLLTMETGKTKGIIAEITPTYLDYSDLIFESENPEIATVDEEGIVTAVIPGSTNIYVYSSDRALWTYVSVNVVDPIPLETLETEEYVLMFDGDQHQLDVDITPLASTESITYTSSDNSIVTVDKRGRIAAIATGEATITVAGEHGLAKEVKVIVVSNDFNLSYPDDIILAEVNDEVIIKPVLSDEDNDSLYSYVKYSSSNPEYAHITEENTLLGTKQGRISIRAEIPELDLSADSVVYVMNEVPDQQVKQFITSEHYGYLAVMESGDVWYWGEDNHYAVHTGIYDAETIGCWAGNSQIVLLVLDKAGTLKEIDVELGEDNHIDIIDNDVTLLSRMTSAPVHTCLYVKKDGSIWQTPYSGDNHEKVNLTMQGSVKQMLCTSNSLYVLDSQGYLYFSGGSVLALQEFSLIDVNVDSLYQLNTTYIQVNKADSYYLMADDRSNATDKFIEFERTENFEVIANQPQSNQDTNTRFKQVENKLYAYGSDTYGETGTDGKSNYTNGYQEVLRIHNVKEIISSYYQKQNYFITEDGILYGAGSGQYYAFANGTLDNQYVPVRIYFGISDLIDSKDVKEVSDNTEVVMFENQLDAESYELTYNDKIMEYLSFENVKLETTHKFDGYTAITTKEELNAIRNDLSGKYYLASDITFESADFAEGGAFYNDGYGWLPIGDDLTPFAGVLDGNGYKITGLMINESDKSSGLFGEVSGLVRNLSLEIKVDSTSATEGGSITGVLSSTGIIDNCYIIFGGHISLSATNSNAGGIAGVNNGTIKNCSANPEYISGYVAGGIAGSATGVVENCSASMVELSGVKYAGGIAGTSTSTIENCSADTGANTYGNIVGGIAGASTGKIKYCTSLSMNPNTKNSISGGLVGELTGTIENCSVNPYISISRDLNVLGGLVGAVPTQAFNGYEPTDAVVIKNSSFIVNEETEELTYTIQTVGGFVGLAERAVEISECYIGNIQQENRVPVEYTGAIPFWLINENAGWLIGEVRANSVFENCYTTISGMNTAGVDTTESTYTNCNEVIDTINANNYVGFDFENTWTMNYIYPTLNQTETKVGYTLVESFVPNPEDYGQIDAGVDLTINSILIKPVDGFEKGGYYRVTVPLGAVKNSDGAYNHLFTTVFKSIKDTVAEDEYVVPPVIHDTVVDEEKMEQREEVTEITIASSWEEFAKKGLNTRFYSNVILNRLDSEDVESWLRIMAPNYTGYEQISLGGNYWGTANEDLVNKQILDYDDYQHLANVNIGEYLTEAPDNTYPFVVDAYLEVEGEQVDTVGNDLVTFVVNFNRDMDTSIELDVRFGSSYPYAEYQVEGAYVEDNPRQWRGTMQLTTIIENGYQYWSVSNGKAAETSYKLYKDWGRFPFMIDTSSAQSLMMNAVVEPTGIQLTWIQDSFETLAGYNVYRSTSKDGLYVKLNKTMIPADTKEWFDDEVLPGQLYYYNFTVVQSDMTESEPSGKVSVTALDTMAPDVYHTPVYNAFTGQNLIIDAIVTDNIGISSATVHYRIKGTEEYLSVPMTHNNDKYSAIISSDYVTLEGIEYYIEATDGITSTYKGTAEQPYEVIVQQAVTANQMGDVNGDGQITLQDAMKVLYAKYGRYNMTTVEFVRADLNGNDELESFEALIIIQYVNGTITSIPTFNE